MNQDLTALAYLVAAICFIMALRGLSSPESSRGGNRFGIAGMVIAIATTLAQPGVVELSASSSRASSSAAAIGTFIALRIKMTALPQLVAAFHSLVGLAAVCVAAAAFFAPQEFGIGEPGAIARRQPDRDGAGRRHRRHHLHRLDRRLRQAAGPGDRRAAGLQGPASAERRAGHRHRRPDRLAASSAQNPAAFWLLVGVSLLLGFLLILPIGGADMPVVVSMLNSYSGWAACGIGFTLGNNLLIVTGALVGSSGAILSYIMCKGMNRSIFNVILGGFGTDVGAAAAAAAKAMTGRSSRAAPRMPPS